MRRQTAYTAWTTYQYSHKQLVGTRVYYDIADGHYNETDYGYDPDGRLEWTKSPDGTITWNVLDARGDVLELDGHRRLRATDADPTGHHDPDNNMVVISSSTYDADGDIRFDHAIRRFQCQRQPRDKLRLRLARQAGIRDFAS